jgi:predicted RNA-binding protein with RPS1 domain
LLCNIQEKFLLGAFMEVLPGKDGLIHVSELAEGRRSRSRRGYR